MKFTYDNIPFRKLPHDYKFSIMKITNFKIKALEIFLKCTRLD